MAAALRGALFPRRPCNTPTRSWTSCPRRPTRRARPSPWAWPPVPRGAGPRLRDDEARRLSITANSKQSQLNKVPLLLELVARPLPPLSSSGGRSSTNLTKAATVATINPAVKTRNVFLYPTRRTPRPPRAAPTPAPPLKAAEKRPWASVCLSEGMRALAPTTPAV